MRSRLVVANHKMNMISSDINKYLKKINNIDNDRVIICPTSIYIPYFLKHKYKVGIQNVFYKNNGAYTGEISPRQAKSMEIDYVLIGHSERRKYFLETNTEINDKVIESLKNNLKVILCIGETEEEKRQGKTNDIIEEQLKECLEDVNNFDNIVIAYEPRWAIGTNIMPTMNEIDINVRYIKQNVKKFYGYEDISVLYGGSINEDNIKELCNIDSVDGFLIGGASTDYDKFLKIIDIVFN